MRFEVLVIGPVPFEQSPKALPGFWFSGETDVRFEESFENAVGPHDERWSQDNDKVC